MNVTGTNLGDEGVALLASHLPTSLKLLDLRSELCPFRVTYLLFRLFRPGSIDVICDFSENGITSLGIEAIAQSFNNLIHLEYLWLGCEFRPF